MNHSPPYGQEYDVEESFTLPEELPQDVDLTTVRLRFKKVIQIAVSPLILPAVTLFEDDINSVVSAGQSRGRCAFLTLPFRSPPPPWFLIHCSWEALLN